MADHAHGDALVAWLAATEAELPTSQAGALAAAEAWAALAGPTPGPVAAMLACAVSGALGANEMEALLADPIAADALETAAEFANSAAAAAPSHLVALAQSILTHSADVIAFPHQTLRPIGMDIFRLRAAANATRDSAMLCKSESGVWTLEVFVAQSEAGRAQDHASILLTVDPDYRTTYEGLYAKVFVSVDGVERVLANAVITNGELYATASLAGIDLHARDAINVLFSLGPDDAP